jgi:predicted ABC-type transport system involved in lysophospholipase L1 biosynthesis ATPase subunit
MVTHDDLVAARAPRRMRLEAGRMRADSAVGTPS